MVFPELVSKDRDREYKAYSETVRAKVVYEYLFNGNTNRWLDSNILGIDPKHNQGYQSMGILHHLGLRACHKGFFKEMRVLDAIKILTDLNRVEFKPIIEALNAYSESIYNSNNIELFTSPISSVKLYKKVGSSQFTDGVRIEKEYHINFNPPETSYYVSRGTARQIKVLFNNKVFNAEYRYEDQMDKFVELQSICFRKDLKEEFKKVFPTQEGEFIIQQGIDLNHFVFTHLATNIDLEDCEYNEGKAAYKTHLIRERNPYVIKKAKERFMKKNNGQLFCEVCNFNFSQIYGERGNDFIEGHHKKLVSEMRENEKTKVEDIAMLCSNCHRMIHRKPIISISELKNIVNLISDRSLKL